MTNQQGAPDALTDFERRHAIRQGYEIAASDGYFEARPQIDSNDRRKVFQAGFERGWDRHAALVEAQQPAPSAASKAVLAAIRAANMQLVRTGDDAFMLVPHKVAAPQADNAPTSVEDAENKQAGFAHSDWSFKAEVLDTSPPSAGEKFLEEPDVQDESGLNKYYSRELVLICIEEALASKAAPQADSQPSTRP